MSDQVPPTRAYHWWQLGLLLLLVGMIGWSAFVRPSNRTTVQAGGTVVNNYDVPKVPLMGLSCMRLNGSVYWQTDPKNSTGVKK